MSEEASCPVCGTKYQTSIIKCEVCGWSLYKRIRLIGTNGERSFGGDIRIGRALIRTICGEEDAKFADSTDQFSLSVQTDKQWVLNPGKGTEMFDKPGESVFHSGPGVHGGYETFLPFVTPGQGGAH